MPDSISSLITSQAAKGLEDYETMTPDVLLKKLERIVRTSFDPKSYPQYALTADNFLKMSLIVSIYFINGKE